MGKLNAVTAYQVHAAILRTADKRGVARVSVAPLAAELGVKQHIIGARLSLLLAVRALSRVKRGLFRVHRFHATDRKRADPRIDRGAWMGQTQPPLEPKPCGYATARACGIEPAVFILPQRSTNGGTVGDIAISLSRIPSLERPLP